MNKPQSVSPLQIAWIPAHPSFGNYSMDRYARFLSEQRQDGDRYKCEMVIPLQRRARGRITRQLYRRFIYPMQLQLQDSRPLAHVLDHSWSHMLRYLPATTKTVVTVHDLIPLRFPGELKPDQVARFRSWVENIKHADMVIADSDYTKTEVHSYLEIPLAKIHVVPLGVEMPEPHLFPVKKTDEFFRIGSIGSCIHRKNLNILPAALRALKETSEREPILVRVGEPLPTKLADEVRQALGNNGLQEMGKLDDGELAAFYASLDCVVIPSLYEGFGLPVLEGLAAGVPVICSNVTSLPEVGGDAVIYFDPTCPDELAECLRNLERDGVPSGWIERGLLRAESFSWRASLEAIYKVYDIVLGCTNAK
jgi:glycosyltransferase involved in cell wall biosynthesis